MSMAVVHSRANVGIETVLVSIEIHLDNGLPSLSIVGLPEAVVKESKDRVRSALKNSHFDFPCGRITINLAPADLPKEGSRFDLPIAVGILMASGQLPSTINDYELVGELALSGQLRPVKGCLPIALACAQLKKKLILPQLNAEEVSIVKHCEILPAHHLLQICAHFCKQSVIEPFKSQFIPVTSRDHDMKDVKGQHHIKRALEIAAAGAHNVLMVGPPGTGKSMLAERLAGILPELNEEEALITAAIQSISGKPFNRDTWRQRPFRSPHHTASAVALVGGGRPPKPGEISLAHHGVLFLDELPEFNRYVLDSLREPIESAKIHISRAAYQIEFPANFQLIAAMNPCPCGYLSDNNANCRCSADQIRRYHNKLSGPLLDRMDMHLEVLPIKHRLLTTQDPDAESSECIQQRVNMARALQYQRQNMVNARLPNKRLEKICKLTPKDSEYMEQIMKKFNLSARVYHRLLRVARTIADLDQQPLIKRQHLTEAISYRQLVLR